MKVLILVEMLVLWLGNINHYMSKSDASLTDTITTVGVRTAVPAAILSFWLFLVADLGGEKIAALFGAIVAFAYLMGSADAINNITDAILTETNPTTAPAEETPGDETLGDTDVPIA
jgi:hypothetical protein